MSINEPYSISTILLYLALITSSTLFAFLSQRKRIIISDSGERQLVRKSRVGFYIVSFLILSFFACFTANGIDKNSYKYLFEANTWNYRYPGVEIGFWLFINIAKLVIRNETVFLGVIAFVTCFFTYKGIWDCRDKLSVGLAVFVFSSQYYFQSYNLMRMYFALSILVLGAKYAIVQKSWKYLVFCALATAIHFSSIFVLLAYIVVLALVQRNKGMNRLLFCCLMVATLIVSMFAMQIASSFSGLGFEFAEKYSTYLSQAQAGQVGFKLILNLIPFVLVFWLFRHEKDQHLIAMAEGYGAVVFILSFMSYSIPVLARAITLFGMFNIIILPIALEKYRTVKCRVCNGIYSRKAYVLTNYKALCIVLFAYFSLLLFFYLRDYLNSDGINNFKFIWQ